MDTRLRATNSSDNSRCAELQRLNCLFRAVFFEWERTKGGTGLGRAISNRSVDDHRVFGSRLMLSSAALHSIEQSSLVTCNCFRRAANLSAAEYSSCNCDIGGVVSLFMVLTPLVFRSLFMSTKGECTTFIRAILAACFFYAPAVFHFWFIRRLVNCSK